MTNETITENHTHDYITVVTTPSPCNKRFTITSDGNVTKKSGTPLGFGVAKTIAVPSLANLKVILESVSRAENQLILLGYNPQTTDGEPYVIMSKVGLAKAGVEQGELWSETEGGKQYAAWCRLKANYHASSYMVMDYDPAVNDGGIVYDSFEQVDTELIRRLNDAGVGWLRVASNSGRVTINGEPCIAGVSGYACHYYIKLDEAADRYQVERAFKQSKTTGDVFAYPIANNMGDGETRETLKTAFDNSVFGAERVIYDGKPVVSDKDAVAGLVVADIEVSVRDGNNYNVEAINRAIQGQWVFGDGQGWYDRVSDGTLRVVARMKEGTQGGSGGGGDYESLPNNTVFETTEYGDMTFAEYEASGHGKLRCQSLRVDSTSEAAFLDKNKDGRAHYWDTQTGIAYPEGIDVAILAEGFDDEPVEVVEADEVTEDEVEDWETVGEVVDDINQVFKDDAMKGVDETTEEGRLTALIVNCDSEPLLKTEVARTISVSGVDDIIRGRLVSVMQERIGVLTKHKPLSKPVVELLKPPVAEIFSSAKPRWCERWVYLLDEDKFLNTTNGTKISQQAFNADMAHHVPIDEKQNRPQASRFVFENRFVFMCDTTSYQPASTEMMFKDKGSRIANTYIHKLIPKAADTCSDDVRLIIERHIEMVFGEHADTFKMWLAHQVQFPGKLLRWAPIVVSFEGIGKSTFTVLLRNVMGDKNVGSVTKEEIGERFTGWAEGNCVVTMEEIRVAGQNRHEVAGSLKEKITNDVIRIERKGRDGIDTLNTVNYICFTNEGDALPIKVGDRRWWVVMAKLLSDAAMSEYIKEKFNITRTEYFNQLYAAIEKYPDQIRRLLLDTPLSSEFLNSGVAPMSDDKMRMIQTENDKHPAYESIHEVLVGGYVEIGKLAAVQSTILLRVKSQEDIMGNRTSGAMIMRTLRHMGWGSRKIRINGAPTRIVARTDLSIDEIKYEIALSKGGTATF